MERRKLQRRGSRGQTTFGSPTNYSNSGNSRRRTQRMSHGGYHANGNGMSTTSRSNMRTSMPMTSRRRNINRLNRMSGTGRVNVNNIMNMYPEVDLIAQATLLDCPALGNNPDDVQRIATNTCPNTGAIQIMKNRYNPGGDMVNGWAEWCCFLASMMPNANAKCCDKVPDPPPSQ